MWRRCPREARPVGALQLCTDFACRLPQVWRYAVKLAADWVCLELLTHFLYFNSIAKHRIGMRYRQYGLQYAAPEMGECRWRRAWPLNTALGR